jgi:hypothetical protein
MWVSGRRTKLVSRDSIQDAHRTWVTAEKIKRIADRLIGLGPFSVGVDGLLAFVPVAGTVFSVVAGTWLLREAVRVRASRWTLTRMALYVGIRSFCSVVPFEGWLADFFFRGHMMAAHALQKDIVRRYGPPPRETILQARRRPFAASPQAEGALSAY